MSKIQLEDSNETLESWLSGKVRINSTSLLDSLDELGANQPIDLLDLTDEDISNFQPPFLKKLEFIRFKRGISLLKQTAGNDIKVDQLDSTDIVIASATVIQESFSELSSDEDFITSEGNTYQRPPIPLLCVEDGCDGILSSKLGKRKTKYLTTLDGPDFRWIISCSNCSSKWHSCHFLCGHMQKISYIGSSEIIRHEQGRYNRWQKKIKPPCSKNPRGETIKLSYQKQKNNQKIKKNEHNESNHHHFNSNANNSTQRSSSSNSVSVEHQSMNPKNEEFDSEFHAIMSSMDEGNLDFSDFDANESVPPVTCNSNVDFNKFNKSNEEPARKRAKGISIPTSSNDTSGQEIDQLCDDVVVKCLLDGCNK